MKPAACDAVGPSDAPQLPQKFSSGSFRVPHAAQTSPRERPHLAQKRLDARFP
jgi:hypothetical protein